MRNKRLDLGHLLSVTQEEDRMNRSDQKSRALSSEPQIPATAPRMQVSWTVLGNFAR